MGGSVCCCNYSQSLTLTTATGRVLICRPGSWNLSGKRLWIFGQFCKKYLTNSELGSKQRMERKQKSNNLIIHPFSQKVAKFLDRIESFFVPVEWLFPHFLLYLGTYNQTSVPVGFSFPFYVDKSGQTAITSHQSKTFTGTMSFRQLLFKKSGPLLTHSLEFEPVYRLNLR